MVRSELPLLYRVAYRVSGGPESAEDLVAQTLYHAARAWLEFDGRHPRAWLIRILHHAHIRMSKSISLCLTAEPEIIESVVDSRNDVHQQAVQNWSQEVILRALSRLSPEYRMAIVLCDIEGMSYDEVRDALDLPLGTLSSRLHRARNQMQTLCYELGDSL